MPQAVTYAVVLLAIAGLTWPGSPAGKALVAVTSGTAQVLRGGATFITGQGGGYA